MQTSEALLIAYEALYFISESERLTEEFLDSLDETVELSFVLKKLEAIIDETKRMEAIVCSLDEAQRSHFLKIVESTIKEVLNAGKSRV